MLTEQTRKEYTTRTAVVVNLHSAAGVGHALGNIFTASKNQTPMVIIAGQQARSLLPYDAFLHARQATEFPQPYVKWSCEPARAEDVPAAIARAYYIAMQAPCGPTFVSVPVDDWDKPCEPLAARQVSQSVSGDPALLSAAADALNRAARPVIVVGASVARDDAWDETIALAERHRALVWASPMSSRNSFPENHPLFAGFLPADRNRIVTRLAGHDLILVLGAPAFTYHMEGSGPHIPDGAELLQLIDDPSIGAWSPAGTSIFTSLKPGVRALLDAAQPVARPAPKTPERAARLPGTELTDAYLMQQIAALRPAGSIIVEEAPSSRHAMHEHLPLIERDTFYTCASGGLGYSLPAAVGVALARPREKVIALIGDGSSMYSIQSLWSAAQAALPIAFVIVRNGNYEALTEFGRRFNMPDLPGTQLPGLDFVGLARSQGVPGVRVERIEELDSALRAAFQSSTPMLVEVVVSPSW